ncbi:MAG: hypothetical protein JWR80_7005 [Bradyrhizobium sp.]|nr:hypothetical protein [Bradyrhizobium sp.]
MMRIQSDQNTALSFTSLRVRGEVAALFARRVRGTLRAFAEAAPHPNPLPVKNGERGEDGS